MDFISKYFTFSSPNPDEIGYGYLHLFKEQYRQKLSRKLGKSPKSKDIIKVLPHDTQYSFIIITSKTCEYLDDGYLTKVVNRDERTITLKPSASSIVSPLTPLNLKEFNIEYERSDTIKSLFMYIFQMKEYKIQ